MNEAILVALIGGHFTILAALIQRSGKRQSAQIAELVEMLGHCSRRLDDHIHFQHPHEGGIE
jgi:hypothetical protein